MELVAPVTFTTSLVAPPFNSPLIIKETWPSPLKRFQQLSIPTQILAMCFLIHYINRSTISCLRTSAPRSRMHLIVPTMAAGFNLCNGFLLGSYMGGRTYPISTHASLFDKDAASLMHVHPSAQSSDALFSFKFWFGVSLWCIGFMSNIYHDEILHRLRDLSSKSAPTDASESFVQNSSKDNSTASRYSIPHGGLFSFPLGGISFPNYLSEWIEWVGFALAAASGSNLAPVLPFLSATNLTTNHITGYSTIFASNLCATLATVAKVFAPRRNDVPGLGAAPPMLFLWAEIAVMMPRALQGHQWYQNTFADFPKDRKAVLPGLL